MPDLRKRRGLLRKPRRAPKPLAPTGVQLRYRAFLQALVARAHALVKARLYPRLPELLGEHADAHADAHPRSVNRVLQQITEAFDRAYPQRRLERMARDIAGQTSEHQRGQLQRQLKAALGVDLETIADTGVGSATRLFIAQNVALVRTVPRDYFADVEAQVLEALRTGQRHEQLAETLEERLGVAEDRAALIARDQVLSFQADLNRLRQESLGITRYRWRTGNDERVREKHAERDFDTGDPPGQIFDWDDGPGDPTDPGDGQNPGDGINCRCWGEGVLEDVLPGADE